MSQDLLTRIYNAFDPFKPLPAGDPAYVDCQEVRGDTNILVDLGNKIFARSNGLTNQEMETAIRQVVDQALVSDTVINIFDEAGIKNPDLSIISDEFMAEVRGMEHQNLAVELLKKLLKDEIKNRSRTNIVQSRKLFDMLEDALRRYRNQAISATDILEELLKLAKDTNAANARGEELGLEPYELAFYDALSQNHSAVDVMGVVVGLIKNCCKTDKAIAVVLYGNRFGGRLLF